MEGLRVFLSAFSIIGLFTRYFFFWVLLIGVIGYYNADEIIKYFGMQEEAKAAIAFIKENLKIDALFEKAQNIGK